MNHYTQGREIKAGGQGKVYEYTPRSTGIVYAVKVIRYNFDSLDEDGDPDNVIRIQREIAVSQELDHVGLPSPPQVQWNAYSLVQAHLLRAHAIFECKEGSAIVMPFYHRGHLRRKSVRPFELKEAIRQILEALRYLHTRGQIHRDIKPGNILVRSEESEPIDLVVADYGLISLQDPVSFGGTDGYAAPEIAHNGQLDRKHALRYSANVDIYPLVIVILDLLGVEIVKALMFDRERFDQCVTAKIAAALDACDPNDIDRRDALSAAETMLQYESKDRPSVDKCLCMPWLCRQSSGPQAALLIATPASFPMITPQSSPASTVTMPTWWHSDASAPVLMKQALQSTQASQKRQKPKSRQACGRYNFRERKHTPLSTPKKARVQKRSKEPLRTPTSALKNIGNPEKPHRFNALKFSTSETSRYDITDNPSKNSQGLSPEYNDLLSWDKMELSE